MSNNPPPLRESHRLREKVEKYGTVRQATAVILNLCETAAR